MTAGALIDWHTYCDNHCERFSPMRKLNEHLLVSLLLWSIGCGAMNQASTETHLTSQGDAARADFVISSLFGTPDTPAWKELGFESEISLSNFLSSPQGAINQPSNVMGYGWDFEENIQEELNQGGTTHGFELFHHYAPHSEACNTYPGASEWKNASPAARARMFVEWISTDLDPVIVKTSNLDFLPNVMANDEEGLLELRGDYPHRQLRAYINQTSRVSELAKFFSYHGHLTFKWTKATEQEHVERISGWLSLAAYRLVILLFRTSSRYVLNDHLRMTLIDANDFRYALAEPQRNLEQSISIKDTTDADYVDLSPSFEGELLAIEFRAPRTLDVLLETLIRGVIYMKNPSSTMHIGKGVVSYEVPTKILTNFTDKAIAAIPDALTHFMSETLVDHYIRGALVGTADLSKPFALPFAPWEEMEPFRRNAQAIKQIDNARKDYIDALMTMKGELHDRSPIEHEEAFQLQDKVAAELNAWANAFPLELL